MTYTSPVLQHSKLRLRIAVTCFFIAQGLVFASWMSRLPDMKADFNVDNIMTFAGLLFLIPVGKFFAIPLVGALFPLIGSKKTVLISILGFILSPLIIGFIDYNIYLLGVVMFLFGLFWNMTDISLNTQAIEVERIYGSPIIASFHASWSLSACIGALIGYGMINLNVNTKVHFIFITILSAIIIFSNYRILLDIKHTTNDKSEEKALGILDLIRKRVMPEKLLIQLGFIWLLALIVENTMFDWSDMYFQSVIEAPKSMQIGLLVFMLMMFVGRIITNLLYSIWSKSTVLKVAGLLIFLGFTTASVLTNISDDLIVNVVINSVGFMLIGLGISCVVPTLYSIVAEKAQTPPGMSLTIMSAISFVGPLISPVLVGYISHQFNMEYAYLAIGVVGLLIIALASVGSMRK